MLPSVTVLVSLLIFGVKDLNGYLISSLDQHISLSSDLILQRRSGLEQPFLHLPLNVSRTQDSSAAVKQLYGRPNDPEVRQSTGSRTASLAIDEVEDALARANSVRNAKPQRYLDAKMAYEFTARLNPRDPRPLMGLGNVAYDQKQFAAAAKMYQESLTMVTSMASFGGATLRGELNPAEQRNMASELRLYLGISLLETNDFKNAQAQFERAVKSEPTNPRCHALLGYSFFKQGIKPEAVKSFQEAVRLDPGNSEYQQLLQSAQQ